MRVDLNGRTFETVNDLLNLNWVSIGRLDFLRIGEGDVFKTVYLAEAPEHGISILASALDLEHLTKVKFLKCVQSEVVDHLVLGQRLRRVDAQVVGDISVRVEGLEGVEEAELAHDVLRGGVVGVGHALELGLSELREYTPWQLHAAIEGAHESSQGDGVSEPGLAENRVVVNQVSLDGSNVPSTNGTTNST